MTFKQAVTLSKGYTRYIQRENGRTIFDVVQYNPDRLEEEDLWSDDWSLVGPNEKVKYFDD